MIVEPYQRVIVPAARVPDGPAGGDPALRRAARLRRDRHRLPARLRRRPGVLRRGARRRRLRQGAGRRLSAGGGGRARRTIMHHFDAALEGTPDYVWQAGTLNGNPVAAVGRPRHAGRAAQARAPTSKLFATGTRLRDGLAAAAPQARDAGPGERRAARVRHHLHRPAGRRLPRHAHRRPPTASRSSTRSACAAAW